MTELRELLEETANSAPPPSRLVADELYAAGRRRRRRRAVANCAAVVALVMTAGTGVASMMRQERSVSGETGVDQEQSLLGVLPHRGELIQWASAADAHHLYVTMSTHLSCSKEPCAKTIVQMVGSDDGGRTWSDRGGPINAVSFRVLGPGRLLAAILPDTPGVGARTLQVSTDGGRIWRKLVRASAVAGVPAGGTAVCWPESDKVAETCTVHALDAAPHRLAPLTSQPPFALDEDSSIAQTAGRLWASGVDPATGRPAVAVSRDAGRSWASEVFADAPACQRGGCPAPHLAVGDGPAVYAVIDGAGRLAVYRYVESGGQGGDGWQPVSGADELPADRLAGGTPSFVTSDGTHVLSEVVAQPGQGIDGYRWWAARPDGVYQPVELDGLPPTVKPIRRTPDGWFYTHSYTDGMLYGSADGWRWLPVARSS
ncbi:sialidase family protein [Micromonospora sp. LOL_024]|uniref:sialidase family protein n=1 Tax=Micromonospora sp. LOL_024 TaxID=3345412 RepID=UPI003A83D3B6